MIVEEFRFLKNDDIHNSKIYPNWSRTYEYPIILNFLNKKINNNEKIHNSSWGFEGVHVKFRDELDKIADCLHSDIVNSNYRKTYYYDVLSKDYKLVNNFDFVINVSTIEHLSTSNDQIKALNNLYKQVKEGGYLIVTFDYPRVDLKLIEDWVDSNCKKDNNILNGENSIYKNEKYKHLNIILLIIKKDKNI